MPSKTEPARLAALAEDKFASFHHWLPDHESDAQPAAGLEASCIAAFRHPDAGRVVAHVKFYPDLGKISRGLVNEITGHLIAQHYGLPLPQPAFLAEIPLKKLPLAELPRRHRWLRAAAKLRALYPAWCTAEVNAPTPWHHYHADSPAIRADLDKWPQLSGTLVLDHILANVDRNLRNLLRSGPHAYCLIDHGRMASNGHWQRVDLDPARTYSNRLLEFSTHGRPPARAQANGLIHNANEFNGKGLPMAELARWWPRLLNEEDRVAFDSFLSQRAKFAASHFTERYALC
jgi:hypothetical protein